MEYNHPAFTVNMVPEEIHRVTYIINVCIYSLGAIPGKSVNITFMIYAIRFVAIYPKSSLLHNATYANLSGD